jgi:hypothetical protein
MLDQRADQRFDALIGAPSVTSTYREYFNCEAKKCTFVSVPC